MTPLLFDRPGAELPERLIAAVVARGGFARSVDGSAGSWRDALRRLAPGVVPQLVIGAPLATLRPFEAAHGSELEAFSTDTLLGLWSTLRDLAGQEYRDGASIVVLQSSIALELRPEAALARAALFAVRAMLKAAALECRDRNPVLRFNLLLVPPVEPPVDRILAALEQVASSPFLTGGELVLRVEPASPGAAP